MDSEGPNMSFLSWKTFGTGLNFEQLTLSLSFFPPYIHYLFSLFFSLFIGLMLWE